LNTFSRNIIHKTEQNKNITQYLLSATSKKPDTNQWALLEKLSLSFP